MNFSINRFPDVATRFNIALLLDLYIHGEGFDSSDEVFSGQGGKLAIFFRAD